MTETTLYIVVIISILVNAIVLHIIIASATKARTQLHNQEMTNFYLKKIVDFIENKKQSETNQVHGYTDLNDPKNMADLLEQLKK